VLMEQGRVIWDIDDVFRHSTYRISEIFAERHGLTFEHPAYMENGALRGMFILMKEATGLPGEVITREVEDILCSDEFKAEMQPAPGTYDTVMAVGERWPQAAVSSCPACIKNDTIDWINDHYGDAIDPVVVIGTSWGHGPSISKEDAYQQLEAAYVVDDLLSNVRAARKVGAVAILYGDYPWNRTNNIESDIIRCKNMDEVRAFFDAER
jgi:hypothetical protein